MTISLSTIKAPIVSPVIPPRRNNISLRSNKNKILNPTNTEILFHFNNDCSITLPIELVLFKGDNKKTHNKLSWLVASENENHFFELERSTNGKDWVYLDKILGRGSSLSDTLYSYNDFGFTDGINYYRLSQTDFNGTKRFLDIVSIDNSVDGDEVVKITNLLGQEINPESKEFKIIYYKNGKTIKTF